MQRVNITVTPTRHGVLVRAHDYVFTFFDISRIRIDLRSWDRIAPKIRGVARLDNSAVYIEAIGDMSLLAEILQQKLIIFAAIPVTVEVISLRSRRGNRWQLVIKHVAGQDIQEITTPLVYNLNAVWEQKMTVLPEPSPTPDAVYIVVETTLLHPVMCWYETLSELPLPRLDVVTPL